MSNKEIVVHALVGEPLDHCAICRAERLGATPEQLGTMFEKTEIAPGLFVLNPDKPIAPPIAPKVKRTRAPRNRGAQVCDECRSMGPRAGCDCRKA